MKENKTSKKKKNRVIAYFLVKYVKELVAQWCPTVCDPMDYSPPGASAHEYLKARILEWVTIYSLGDLPK